jgi:hypothetical protein
VATAKLESRGDNLATVRSEKQGMRAKLSLMQHENADSATIKNGGVGEWLNPAVLKAEIADSLSDTKIQPNAFASRQIARLSIFWSLLILVQFAPVIVTIG